MKSELNIKFTKKCDKFIHSAVAHIKISWADCLYVPVSIHGKACHCVMHNSPMIISVIFDPGARFNPASLIFMNLDSVNGVKVERNLNQSEWTSTSET